MKPKYPNDITAEEFLAQWEQDLLDCVDNHKRKVIVRAVAQLLCDPKSDHLPPVIKASWIQRINQASTGFFL